eukprot:CAMPEP_0178984142 /NCGR_PEP_ID=MMETSP0795-20121207/1440_1 /TAXON_ID=88552 /ORGANISM="Amoebophrya sp., Strain Ameob2" /LENGTH=180 /DNA_ID=CAMNT_0020674971 /DNA_START=1036 /DNA_END=1573 /DNA_ORIENTATION=-
MDFAGFDLLFPQLNRESYYEDPPHSSGTLCAIIVWILTFIRLCMSGFLFAKSREFEQSETSSETEQDDEEEVAHAKAMFAKMKGKSPEAMKAKKKGNMMKKKGKGDDGIHAPGGGAVVRYRCGFERRSMSLDRPRVPTFATECTCLEYQRPHDSRKRSGSLRKTRQLENEDDAAFLMELG